jgi:hypothetical protein
MWSGSLVAGVPAGTIGRVSASSPARDAQRRRAGGMVLDAVVGRITEANEETGDRIARVTTDRSGSDLVTVVGALLGVQPGALTPTRTISASRRTRRQPHVGFSRDPQHQRPHRLGDGWSDRCKVLGETSRSRRSGGGSSLLNAQRMARSSQVSLGCGWCRRRTVTSLRTTRISLSLLHRSGRAVPASSARG